MTPVAFYGGSFDPPHVAHVLAVAYLAGMGQFDRVLVVPVFRHAFEKRLTPFGERLRMCELAVGWLPGVEVTGVEEVLATPSLTVRTLSHLRREHPDYQLRLVVGADVLGEVGRWHAFDEVCRAAPLMVLGRAGFAHPDAGPTLLPAVSSTEVRELLLRRGQPAVDDRLRALVPSRVLHYIDERGLYQR